MIQNLEQLLISPDSSILAALEAISKGAKQIVLVVDENRKLLGTVTDGDIRRGLLRTLPLEAKVSEVMNPNPHTASPDEDASEVMTREAAHLIRNVPVVDADGIVVGLLTDEDRLVAKIQSTPVVLMAGGKGVRLHPLTIDTPKPMLKIGDTPIIEIIIRNLRRQGFRKIYISVNYLAEVIENHIKDGAWLDVEVEYLREDQPLGTAGAIAQLNGTMTEPFLVMNSDLLTKTDFRQLVKNHKKTDAAATLGVREYSFQIPYGVVNLNGDAVESISEKPTHRSLVSAGIYALSPEALKLANVGEYCDMPTLLDRLRETGEKVVAFPIHESWLDIGRFDDLELARNNMSHWMAND
jgi:dTDP-glucose pyrophosphorylase